MVPREYRGNYWKARGCVVRDGIVELYVGFRYLMVAVISLYVLHSFCLDAIRLSLEMFFDIIVLMGFEGMIKSRSSMHRRRKKFVCGIFLLR